MYFDPFGQLWPGPLSQRQVAYSYLDTFTTIISKFSSPKHAVTLHICDSRQNFFCLFLLLEMEITHGPSVLDFLRILDNRLAHYLRGSSTLVSPQNCGQGGTKPHVKPGSGLRVGTTFTELNGRVTPQ